MSVEILQEIKSRLRSFIIIKYVLKAKLDKTLHANFFNCTILPAISYTSGARASKKKGRTATRCNTEGYEMIHAWNIIAWAHPKWGTSRADLNEGYDHGVPKVELTLSWTYHKVSRQQVDPCSCWVASGRLEMTKWKTFMTMRRQNC